MSLDEFAVRFPRLNHMADENAWGGIQRHDAASESDRDVPHNPSPQDLTPEATRALLEARRRHPVSVDGGGNKGLARQYPQGSALISGHADDAVRKPGADRKS